MKLLLAILVLSGEAVIPKGDWWDSVRPGVNSSPSGYFRIGAQDSEFSPLREILLRQQSNDLNYYIGKRCVAVGFVSVKLFEGSQEFEQENEKVRSKTMQLINVIIGEWAPSNGQNLTFDDLMGQVGPLIELYKQKVKESYRDTGNPRSEFLLNDLNICKDIYWGVIDQSE